MSAQFPLPKNNPYSIKTWGFFSPMLTKHASDRLMKMTPTSSAISKSPKSADHTMLLAMGHIQLPDTKT